MNDVISSEPTVEVANERLSKLRVFNTLMGFLHLASGVAMIALGNDFDCVFHGNRSASPGFSITPIGGRFCGRREGSSLNAYPVASADHNM